MGKHTRRFRYTRQQGKTWVSCTKCGENLVPAPRTFEEDPICRDCRPISQRRHFAGLVAGLVAAEITVLCVVLGFDGIKELIQTAWAFVTPW